MRESKSVWLAESSMELETKLDTMSKSDVKALVRGWKRHTKDPSLTEKELKRLRKEQLQRAKEALNFRTIESEMFEGFDTLRKLAFEMRDRDDREYGQCMQSLRQQEAAYREAWENWNPVEKMGLKESDQEGVYKHYLSREDKWYWIMNQDLNRDSGLSEEEAALEEERGKMLPHELAGLASDEDIELGMENFEERSKMLERDKKIFSVLKLDHLAQRIESEASALDLIRMRASKLATKPLMRVLEINSVNYKSGWTSTWVRGKEKETRGDLFLHLSNGKVIHQKGKYTQRRDELMDMICRRAVMFTVLRDNWVTNSAGFNEGWGGLCPWEDLAGKAKIPLSANLEMVKAPFRWGGQALTVTKGSFVRAPFTKKILTLKTGIGDFKVETRYYHCWNCKQNRQHVKDNWNWSVFQNEGVKNTIGAIRGTTGNWRCFSCGFAVIDASIEMVGVVSNHRPVMTPKGPGMTSKWIVKARIGGSKFLKEFFLRNPQIEQHVR